MELHLDLILVTPVGIEHKCYVGDISCYHFVKRCIVLCPQPELISVQDRGVCVDRVDEITRPHELLQQFWEIRLLVHIHIVYKLDPDFHSGMRDLLLILFFLLFLYMFRTCIWEQVAFFLFLTLFLQFK